MENHDINLRCLKRSNDSSVEKAKQLISDNKINISLAKTGKKLYISAKCTNKDHFSTAIIEDQHDLSICEC